ALVTDRQLRMGRGLPGAVRAGRGGLCGGREDADGARERGGDDGHHPRERGDAGGDGAMADAMMRAVVRSLAVLVACGASPAAAPVRATPTRPREQIVYTTRRPVGWQVHLVEPGHAASAITRDAALSYDATFAPDGRWVVFVSERSGRPHLHARNLGQPGADLALTSGPFFDGAPSFTPDGRSLVFVSDRDGNANIDRMPFRPGDPRAAGESRNLTR